MRTQATLCLWHLTRMNLLNTAPGAEYSGDLAVCKGDCRCPFARLEGKIACRAFFEPGKHDGASADGCTGHGQMERRRRVRSAWSAALRQARHDLDRMPVACKPTRHKILNILIIIMLPSYLPCLTSYRGACLNLVNGQRMPDDS